MNKLALFTMINSKRGALIWLPILTLREVRFKFIYVQSGTALHNIYYKNKWLLLPNGAGNILRAYRFTYLSFTKQSRPSLFEIINSWTTTHNLKPSIGERFGHFFNHFSVVLLLYLVKKLLSLHLQTVGSFSTWMWRKVHLCSPWHLWYRDSRFFDIWTMEMVCDQDWCFFAIDFKMLWKELVCLTIFLKKRCLTSNLIVHKEDTSGPNALMSCG